MYSPTLIDFHFWTATIGVVLYAVSMWVAGIGEGLMSRAVNADGTLTYAFIEILSSKYPDYCMRLLGGLVYFVGMVVMAYNVYKTVAKEKPVPVAVMDPA